MRPLTASCLPLLLVLASNLTLAAADSGSKPEAPDVAPGQTRSEKAAKGGKLSYWPDRPDQAQPIAATFIGGKGAEWLCAGGFQPDGTIVLAGNVNGGVFDIGAKASVLGTDGAPPPPAEFKSEVNKKGKTIIEKPSWVREDTTGFLVFTTPDLKTITKVIRLPWTSAALTSMVVGDDGAIYVAGRPGRDIGSLGGRRQALEVAPDAERKEGQAPASFVAKIAKDGSVVEWLYTAIGKTDAPVLGTLANGNITFGAQDLRVFDPSGKQISVTVVPGGVRENTSVSPVDGTVVHGGDRVTGTGREPWRCPILRVMEPDGKLRYQLYEWPPSYVVLDNSRAVSDTAVFQVNHDREGNILLYMWSDGGNSVAGAQPTDIRRGAGTSGLGLNAAGAGAMSFCYIVKVEPKDYQIIGWTMWIGRYAGKPNSVGVDMISQGDDSSVLFAGGSAWGLIQTGNKLANGEPAGSFIAVLTPDMSGVRFSSSVPGLGAALVGNDTRTISIGHGQVNHKSRALFLGGATAEQEVYGLVTKTPTLNAAQATYGGGASDGYVVMIDLSAGTPVTPATVTPHPPQRLVVANLGSAVGAKPKPDKNGGPSSTQFEFSATVPKWNHADAEFRVTDASYWPNFITGRPESGNATWAETGISGSYVTVLDGWAQPLGKQDRRVLGQHLLGDKPPKVTLSVTSFGTQATETAETLDNNGKPRERVVTYQPLEATLTIGEVTAKIPFKAVGERGRVTESDMQRLYVHAFATVKGSVLGLKGDLATKDIDIRISAQGIDTGTVSDKKPKKK